MCCTSHVFLNYFLCIVVFPIEPFKHLCLKYAFIPFIECIPFPFIYSIDLFILFTICSLFYVILLN